MNPVILSPNNNILVTFIASFLIWFMVAGIIFLWIADKKVKTKHIVNIFLATFVAFVITELIKKAFPTLRPFEVNGKLPLTFTIPTDSSFPSEHTSLAFALATGIRKLGRKIFYLYLIFAFLVGLGRLLSNVHYYTDIVTGAIIGIGSVLLLERVKIIKFFS
jgi:undecaprenyl-diphosphatase